MTRPSGGSPPSASGWFSSASPAAARATGCSRPRGRSSSKPRRSTTMSNPSLSPPRPSLDGVDLGDRPPGELLPARAFTSHAFYQAELTQVFERAWVHVADLPELTRPGDYVASQIGQVPVVVMRGHD